MSAEAKAVRDKLCITVKCALDKGCGCLEAIDAAIKRQAAEIGRLRGALESTRSYLIEWRGAAERNAREAERQAAEIEQLNHECAQSMTEIANLRGEIKRQREALEQIQR